MRRTGERKEGGKVKKKQKREEKWERGGGNWEKQLLGGEFHGLFINFCKHH